MTLNLQQLIDRTEFDLKKYNFILSMFPDAMAFHESFNNPSCYFKTKMANGLYTKYSISTNGMFCEELFIKLWHEIPFEWDGMKETLKIFTVPFKINLAKLVMRGKKMKKELRVTNYQRRFKSNNIHDLCLKDCRGKIIEFVKKHPDLKLDLSVADKKMKDLFLFL